VRKLFHESFRVSVEMKEALKLLENKTQYILNLIIEDMKNSENSKYVKYVRLESKIQILKKQGQILNAGCVYQNMLKKTPRTQRRNLRKTFINVLEAQQDLTEDNETLELIKETIKQIGELSDK